MGYSMETMHPYKKEYLHHVRTCLGFMFDSAVYTYKEDITEFSKMFCESEYAFAIENRGLAKIAGTSGREMSYYIIKNYNKQLKFKESVYIPDKSPEYWMGFSLAYYQWDKGGAFREIFKAVPVTTMLDMYGVYHEMDISSFVLAIEKKMAAIRQINRLKEYRTRLNISQSELAAISGVPLRTLQQYEQGNKSLKKANATYVLNLARALYCQPQELL